ncbi:MAG: glycosyltransferase [Cyanobacteria bacterium J06600_6]
MVDKKRITFFLDALHGGGAERAVVNILKGLVQRDEFDLDLVLATKEGPYLDSVPSEVRIVDLQAGRAISATFPLVSYLRRNRPWAVVGSMGHVNVVASMATKLSGVKTKLLLVEHNTISANQIKLKRSKLVFQLMKWLYPTADGVGGVSVGVSRDLEQCLGLKPESVRVLHNPVVNEDLIAQSQADLDHPWFAADTPPVFLAVGRLSPQKDFPNLLKAFALVREHKSARLMILGEGEDRSALESMIKDLGITNDVLLPGFVSNPYAYMRHASCFVLSSRQEGLPTVLIEAMACGCPVVSTDCPSGPDEILAGGTYGILAPVKDSAALGRGMLATLENPTASETLKKRANQYSTAKTVGTYVSLLEEL